MIDFYGEKSSYIHLKFGDMRKMYNFTPHFTKKHPKFCEEYLKYWNNDKTGKFENPLQIVNYVDYYNIPVRFYFNYTDTPAKNNKEVQDYLIRETMPKEYGSYDTTTRKMIGWDGESAKED